MTPPKNDYDFSQDTTYYLTLSKLLFYKLLASYPYSFSILGMKEIPPIKLWGMHSSVTAESNNLNFI